MAGAHLAALVVANGCAWLRPGALSCLHAPTYCVWRGVHRTQCISNSSLSQPCCSSPIRQQLYGMPRQQQLQLTTGVAEALARSDATQPAFLRAVSDARPESGSGSLGLPGLPQREPLSARLAAAATARQGSSERDFAAAFTLHSNAMLEPVPEMSESPYAARSSVMAMAAQAAAAVAAGSLSGGKASSTASTAIPTSPLTPASAFAAGSSPLTAASRLPTPVDFSGMPRHQQLSPGLSPTALAAAATPDAAFGWGGSPLAAAMSEAPTPGAYTLASAQRAAGLHSEVPGWALRSPAALSSAGTPPPDLGQLGLSPSAAQRLAQAPTPAARLHGQYEIRHFRCGCWTAGGVHAPGRKEVLLLHLCLRSLQNVRTSHTGHCTPGSSEYGLNRPHSIMQRWHRVCCAPA